MSKDKVFKRVCAIFGPIFDHSLLLCYKRFLKSSQIHKTMISLKFQWWTNSFPQIARGLTRNYCETKKHAIMRNLTICWWKRPSELPADTLYFSTRTFFKFAGVGLQDVGTEDVPRFQRFLQPYLSTLGIRDDESTKRTTLPRLDG